MNNLNRKKHWENIYNTKAINDVSWYQPKPETSLQFIKELNLPKSSNIIDIGGGDSFLVDNLLDLGYTNITVLDISKKAIERAKQRLQKQNENVKWIVADISNFNPTENYDLWHDRAAFHFLTKETEINNYVNSTQNSITQNGYLIIGTFSMEGPQKCSGIEIKQYSKTTLISKFKHAFKKLNCKTIKHKTPFNTIQYFTFCSFTKK
jgi:2-polyprenyl-3-methyl-5-hydroxy-6-metoxy-1,4-benzoquinol methylase